MRYMVAVKQVPDTGSMGIDADGNLIRAGVPSIMNPYCEMALLKALELRGDGDSVEVFTMGPKQSEAMLRRCLELGADRAYLLTDDAFAGSDTWATSRAIEAFIARFACDASLVLFGRQTIDGGTGQVPYETAGLMAVQQFAYVTDIRRDGDSFIATQRYEGSVRRCRVPLGSVVAFDGIDMRGAIPTMQGCIDADSKEIVPIDRVKLGLGLYSVGSKGSPTKIIRTETSSNDRKNRMVVIKNPSTAANLLKDEMEGCR